MPRSNPGLWCKKNVATASAWLGHDKLEHKVNPQTPLRSSWAKPEEILEEYLDFVSFSTAGMMEHLRNKMITVKGRCPRVPALCTHAHTCGHKGWRVIYKVGASRSSDQLHSSETSSHYTLSSWFLSPPTFLTPSSYFCLPFFQT